MLIFLFLEFSREKIPFAAYGLILNPHLLFEKMLIP